MKKRKSKVIQSRTKQKDKVLPSKVAPGKVETVEEYLARGGKVEKCPDESATGIWTQDMFFEPIRNSNDGSNTDKEIKKLKNGEPTKALLGKKKKNAFKKRKKI